MYGYPLARAKRARLVADCIKHIREVPGFKLAIICPTIAEVRAVQREFEVQGGKDLLGFVRFIQPTKRIHGKAYTELAMDEVE